jgi:acetyl esterase/lipase
MTTIVPIWLQHQLRDAGFFCLLSDMAFYATAFLTGLLRPGLILEFVNELISCKRVVYGLTKEHYALTLTFPSPSFGDKRHREWNTQMKSATAIDYLESQEQKISEYLNSGTQLLTSTSAKLYSTIRPIVVFVHGGAWGSGRPWQYLLVAKRFAQLLDAHALVVIGYPVYPKASILQQMQSVRDAVKFFKAHYISSITTSTPQQRPIVICGHSSGANIALLAVLDTIDPKTEPENSKKHVSADMFYGLNGVYDIHDHYQFESNRGVQHISPMYAAAGGEAGFALCSPRLLLRSHVSGISCAPPSSALPRKMVFIHGTQDTTVPLVSSLQAASLSHAVGGSSSITFCPADGHLSPLLDLINCDPYQLEEKSGRHHNTAQVIRHAWEKYCAMMIAASD